MTQNSTGQCLWCERERELVTDEVAESYLVSSPEGHVLQMTYDLVCHTCWGRVRKQWEQNGSLSKPLSAYTCA
jgi:hypothetical protein